MWLCSILIRTLSLIPASGAQILLKTSSQIDLDLFAVGDRDSLCHRNECKSAALTSHPPVQLSALLPSHSHRVDLWISLAPSAHTRLSGTLELITPPHSHLLRYKYTVDSSAWHKFAIIILRPVALFSGGVFLWPDSLFLSVSVFSQSPRRFNLLWLAATPAPVFGAARSSTIEF